ncbi:hypothetical protein M406DRAFT_61479 [Cryphonectria parasitica EP155]|uniref:DH domain-containing protein n=1 Tax=Cryphonectria parasitica (strain ATCC 38755 / EP155) TaxID=660469 RepID=A0A9P4Y659_CRYP1|nr:uncharacterized protein M406DRAFT_61479 [Cryphonectria parasitica EP155]KAF3767647.1 hypothetical protein M406DRAFT_61479 [Cryphonectria parasitica EP155]
MVRVTEELALAPESVNLYYTNDPQLGHLPILVFHGASTTANFTQNSSRIQIHVFTPAGFQSFPRLTVSPNSPFYSVVSRLPREFQGDEVYRGLAFGLFKYFTELPDAVRSLLRKQYPNSAGHRPGSGPALFGEQHAADLAKAMVKSENTADIIQILSGALQTQHISNVDIDLVLPPGSIIPLNYDELEDVPDDDDDLLDPTLRQYGMYASLVKLWGEPVFLPTSKLRRAPSKPTSLNRGKSFSKDQKEELRVKLVELVETEERYVAKVEELVQVIAADFRQCAKNRPSDSMSPTEEEVDRLFPRSADSILELNSAFMHELRRALDETEGGDAVNHVDASQGSVSRAGGSAKAKDPSGALSVARLFLEWFPKFTDSYQDYIRASQNFPHLLNGFLDKQSSFRQRVAQKGDQTIRSILIEPVQRLPRYSLLIDQIVGCLPITHPALQLMLKARDIITNICSMDEPLVDKPHVTNRLRNMIEAWPLDLEPQGRLVLAVDFAELAPPYCSEIPQLGGQDANGILLLFSDCVVMVRKKSSSSPTGRELVREIDKPSPAGLLASMTNAAGGPGSYDLVFTGWHFLADVRFTESEDGHLLWMTSTKEMKAAHTSDFGIGRAVTSNCFVLQEAFEGKAGKLSEDIVKARVEGRFSEKERESPTWTLRSVKMPDNLLGMHAAVFQEAAEQLVGGRREPAPIRIVVDNEKGTKGHPVGHYGVEIVTEVRGGDLRRVRMTTLGLHGKQYTDDVALEDFVPTLSRRIIQLLSTQFNVANLHITPALVSYYTKIGRSLNFNASRAEKTRSLFSTSPVKMLSSFLGGSTPDITSTSPGPKQKELLLSPPPNISRAAVSKESLVSSIRSRTSQDNVPIGFEEDRPENPLVRLEQTFTGYVACLQSRKGHFTARLLMNRSSVDELVVNDLYNRLMESPYDLEASSDVTSETIFVAFEKFVRIAWQEQMGDVMSPRHLNLLLERAGRRVPGEFGDFVRFLFNEMAPQNRRAFTALIKLLASLLEGCGNDGDRGALTLAFAELLVDDGSAHNYINLLDRLVEDCDRIFEDPIAMLTSFSDRSSAHGSWNSRTRDYKPGTGSLNSNTSSLRRKFGFDNLLRSNSKNDGDRSSSIETGASSMPNKLRRPASRDRPRVAGAFDDLSTRPQSVHRPCSSHRLETIGEPDVEVIEPPKPPKKKRRSSLSDLKNLMETVVTPEEEQPTLPLNIAKQTSEKFNSLPMTPQTTRSLRSPRPKITAAGEPLQHIFATPQVPSPGGSIRVRKHAKTLSTSSIPSLKPTRLPLAGAFTPTAPPEVNKSAVKSPTGKLRLQSPQKLRERLQTEKKAVEDVDSSLKSELSRISADMARVNTMLPRSNTQDVRKLSASVKALEDRIPDVLRELDERQKTIQEDMEATVKASEAKVKAIDQLYKEATAENELLYEKFNTELGKIVKAIRGKGREDREELITKLKDTSEETAYVKKENARLRREIVSLRALLKGSGSRRESSE